jgi:hypothetical protein
MQRAGRPILKGKVNKRASRGAPRVSQRAQRFEIKVPVRYREKNRKDWHEGRTENISQSGLLFRAPEPLALESLVELSFDLPTAKEGEPGGTVLCDGKTIRTILPATSDESPGVAVKILNYKMKRSE